jgi:hypothetical protein
MTAIASSTYSRSVYASAEPGRSARPFPRPSTVITPKCRDRYGTCAFHCRMCTIAQEVSSTIAGSPVPYTS